MLLQLLAYVLGNIFLAALIALGAWSVQKLARSPELARWLWILAYVKLLTPPIPGWTWQLTATRESCWLGTCHCGAHGLAGLSLSTWIPAAMLGVWGIGLTWHALRLARNWLWFQRLLAEASPAPRAWRRASERIAKRIGLSRVPAIVLLPGNVSPLVVAGRGQATVVIPAALLERVTPAQRDALLLHELMHLRRGDHWTRLLELAARLFYWWLPLLRLSSRWLHECEEYAIDHAVVSHFPRSRREYARLLLDIVEFSNPLPDPVAPQASWMSAVGELERRVRGILFGAEVSKRRRAVSIATLTIAGALLCVPLDAYGALTTAALGTPSLDSTNKPVSWDHETLASPETPLIGSPIAIYCCSASTSSAQED